MLKLTDLYRNTLIFLGINKFVAANTARTAAALGFFFVWFAPVLYLVCLDPHLGLFLVRCVGFRGGLVFEAHRLLYHSTLGLKVIKKKKILPNIDKFVAANQTKSEERVLGGPASGGKGSKGRN